MLAHENWDPWTSKMDQTKKLDKFSEQCNLNMYAIFPEKNVKISNEDLPFINWKLKGMKRKVQRLYNMRDRRQDDYSKALL